MKEINILEAKAPVNNKITLLKHLIIVESQYIKSVIKKE